MRPFDIIQTSVDTTDGSDGTWVTKQAANFPYSTATLTQRMRDGQIPEPGRFRTPAGDFS